MSIIQFAPILYRYGLSTVYDVTGREGFRWMNIMSNSLDISFVLLF